MAISLPSLAAAQEDDKSSLVFASGLELTAFDTIDEAPVYRARYLAPGLDDDGVDYVSVAGDMDLLCQQDALPRLLSQGLMPERIVVSLMSAPVEFGVMTPDVRQFFESYTVDDGLCIWEAF